MTNDELKEIEARANAATPGPWSFDYCGDVYPHYELSADGKSLFFTGSSPDTEKGGPAMIGTSSWWQQGNPNSQFIAHARTDIPKLIAAVRERDARIEKALKLIKTSIVVEHDCEECGNHTGIRYEIKELVEAKKALEADGKGG